MSRFRPKSGGDISPNTHGSRENLTHLIINNLLMVVVLLQHSKELHHVGVLIQVVSMMTSYYSEKIATYIAVKLITRTIETQNNRAATSSGTLWLTRCNYPDAIVMKPTRLRLDICRC